MTSKEKTGVAERLAEIPVAAIDLRAVGQFILHRRKLGDGTLSRSEINALHNEAMDLYDRYRGGGLEDRDLVLKAYAKERQAADASLSLDTPEPSRTIVLKIAAWLAYDCGELQDAVGYLCAALGGDSPDNLFCEVIRDLRTVVNDSRWRPPHSNDRETPAKEGKPCP